MSVQLRFRNGGLFDYPDHRIHFAFDRFMEDKDVEKISWKGPNGKRLRITKERLFEDTYAGIVYESPKHLILQAGYMEDIISEFKNGESWTDPVVEECNTKTAELEKENQAAERRRSIDSIIETRGNL